ncbi:MAG: M20/M25/M40 family metallo-hydrolase, partial [Phycisphaerae bacterium]
TASGEASAGRHLVLAKWHGGVRPEYFAGAPVRFFDGGKWVRGRVVRVDRGPDGKAPRVSHVEAALAQPVPPGAVGMWDLDGPVVRRGRLFARGCDDVAGVAATLACLDELIRHHSEASLHVLLTRAEEVGFVGAIAACRNRTIPANAVVISIECSAELPGARMGDGPILRVGDLATTFSPAATGWCRAVAERLAASGRPFVFQRKLMDGGTCEATVYGEFGYAATGLCIALGNYHNMDRTRRRLAPEYIDLADWEGLVRWFVALATTDLPWDSAAAGLRERLGKLERTYRQDLEAGLVLRM